MAYSPRSIASNSIEQSITETFETPSFGIGARNVFSTPDALFAYTQRFALEANKD